MSRNGAFLMSREIFDNPIWSDPLKFRLFFFIVGNAVFSDDGVNYGGIQVERGQFLRSLRNLQDDLTYREGRGNAIKKPPIETLRRKIKELEKEGRITTKSTEYGTLFTVLNYDKYQGFDHYKNNEMRQQWDSDETSLGQRWDNNNNDKNVNKEKDYTSKIKDLLTVYASKIPGFIELNKQYWDVIRETRATGKIAESVIYKNMKMWEKYDPVVIQYALKTHIEMHKGKKENYTLGIMRHTPVDEAEDRLNSKVTNLHDYKKQKQEQPQGRYIPPTAEVDFNAGEE